MNTREDVWENLKEFWEYFNSWYFHSFSCSHPYLLVFAYFYGNTDNVFLLREQGKVCSVVKNVY